MSTHSAYAWLVAVRGTRGRDPGKPEAPENILANRLTHLSR